MGLMDRFRKKKSDKEVNLKFTNSIENELLFDMATGCLQENKNEEAIRLFNQILRQDN